MFSRLATIIILAFLVAYCRADEPQVSHEAEVLSNFFDIEGIVFDTSNTDLVKKYSNAVIRDMEVICALKKSDKQENEILRENGDINKMIYQDQLASSQGTQDSIMNALDLIVPDSITDPVLKKSKKELREFAKNNKDLAEELFQRIQGPMKDGDLHTYEAIKFLKNVYYHWIPLADLERAIRSN